jgi:hypothetical protein
MPTSATGVYTLPVGAFVPGDLIKSADMNSDFSDIATALTGRLCVNGANGMAGAFLAADGTAAVPGISFAANPTTGFFSSDAGQFQWASQGVSQGTFGTGGLTIAGTLNVVGTTTLGATTVSGWLAVANLNATNIALSGTLTPPLALANGGTPVYVNNAASGGSANAQTLATASTIPTGYALATGSLIQWNPGFTNTGALTLAPNGLAATNVFKQTPLGAAACTGGETVTSQLALAAFDGTQFQLLNAAKAAGFGAITNLASGATTDLGTIPSQFVNVTGVNTITSFGSSATLAAPIFLVMFAASLAITYNVTSLITPTATNITTQAGDIALCQYLGSGNWKILQFTRANPSTVSTRSFATMGGITYMPTAGCVKARVAMQGPGGGSVGTAGGNTSLGTWTTIGGGNGSSSQIGAAGTGGANGSGSLIKRVPGQAGSLAITSTFSAMGGSSFLGHAQPGYNSFATGTGYGAGAQSFGTVGSGGGGEYAEFWIFSPATMTGVVGTSGAFNGTYTSTPATPGAIFIEEFFQ